MVWNEEAGVKMPGFELQLLNLAHIPYSLSNLPKPQIIHVWNEDESSTHLKEFLSKLN